uniref:Uncharacterized protein n=1 Tax=Hordeum vulgare subsp. vulgare TaxID=112509 RepID=A0A8I6XEM3_HORVV
MAPPAAALLGPPQAIVDTQMADRKPAAKKPTQTKPTPKRAPRGYSSDDYSDSDSDADEPQMKPVGYASSGDPCVDFFFQVVPGATAAADVAALLGVAWAAHARTALRLACHLRGVRGLGKADREGFYAAALWMHANHPRTLAANLAAFARFGCLKDLPEILYRVLHGPRDERKDQDDVVAAAAARTASGGSSAVARRLLRRPPRPGATRRRSTRRPCSPATAPTTPSAFRGLYDGVADLFASLLKSDLEHLRAGETAKIGLAAKCPEYLAIPDKHYAYRVRNRLRREVQVPLRKVLELPEVYMSARKWDELPYARVASTAMRQYKEAFEKHDKEGVAGFYDKGGAPVAPHGVLPRLRGPPHQLHRHVRALGRVGQAAIALGLLISELSQEPWKGRVITFDAAAHQLHKVRGASLVDKLRPLAAVTPRRGANLQAVFNKILNVAVAGALAKDQMVRRVFVVSDMEFDGWTGGEAWVSEHEAIRKRFAAEGFAAPEVVFWNVGTSKAASPVVAAQAGVALVSGYSKNLVRLFLEADGVLTPSAISGPEYDALEVLD